MQETYDHFQSGWQESCEEALRVARNAHHQVLVAAALLEGPIKRLSHPISHDQSGSHGQLDSCQHSHSRRCTRRYSSHPPVSKQEQIPSVVDPLGTLQRGGLSHPALSDPGGGSPSRNIALGRVPQWGRAPPWLGLRCPMEASWKKGTLVPCPFLIWILNTSWQGTWPSRSRRRDGPSETCSPNLLLVTTVSGLSGMVNVWTCWLGGGSYGQSPM